MKLGISTRSRISCGVLLALACLAGGPERVSAELHWQEGKREHLRVRLVALAWSHPRSSFFANEEIFVAEKEISQGELGVIKLIYGFLPYQPRLSDGMDYATVYEIHAMRDTTCDETLSQMSPSHNQSGFRYSTGSPSGELERRRMPLACYVAAPEDFIKSIHEPIEDQERKH